MKKYLLIIIGAFFLSCCSSQKMSQRSETQNSQLDYQQNDSTGISLLDCVALKKIDFSAFTFSDFSFHRIIEEEIDAGEAVFVKRRIVETGRDKSKIMNEATGQEEIQESASLATNISSVHANAASVSSHAVFKQRKGVQWYIISLAAIALGALAIWKRGWIANVFSKDKPLIMSITLITVEQLQNICSQIPEETAIKVTDAINKVCPLYGMNTDILLEFLANVIHESAEFSRYEENLNYSAARLMEVWPSRFKTLADAE